jgi:hypothetical protein
MKLKFLHDSMRFNRETAKEETIKKGQTVDIPDEDVKPEPVVQKKAKPKITKKKK